MRLGVHISLVGQKVSSVFVRAAELKCDTLQFFSRNPQRWRASSLSEEELSQFRQRKREYKVEPVFVHIPYLINLASPNPKLYRDSIKAYVEDILEAHQMQIDYIVTHMGSHKETTEAAGLGRFKQALKKIIKKTAHTKVGILLENTAGSGSWLGYTFRHHRSLIKAVDDDERVGICLDTAHAFQAGYNLATQEGLESLLEELEKEVGLNRIKLIHLNDSKSPLGSHLDRHEHIGKGKIGLEGMARILNNPLLKNLPFILETPKDTKEADEVNLKVVRNLIN